MFKFKRRRVSRNKKRKTSKRRTRHVSFMQGGAAIAEIFDKVENATIRESDLTKIDNISDDIADIIKNVTKHNETPKNFEKTLSDKLDSLSKVIEKASDSSDKAANTYTKKMIDVIKDTNPDVVENIIVRELNESRENAKEINDKFSDFYELFKKSKHIDSKNLARMKHQIDYIREQTMADIVNAKSDVKNVADELKINGGGTVIGSILNDVYSDVSSVFVSAANVVYRGFLSVLFSSAVAGAFALLTVIGYGMFEVLQNEWVLSTSHTYTVGDLMTHDGLILLAGFIIFGFIGDIIWRMYNNLTYTHKGIKDTEKQTYEYYTDY